MAQNETSPFAPIFLYFLAKAYDARSGASLKDKGERQPIPSLPKREGLTNCLRFLLQKFNTQNSTFKVVRLISFARLRTGASALYFLVYE